MLSGAWGIMDMSIRIYIYYCSLIIFLMSILFQTTSGIHILFGYVAIITGLIAMVDIKIKCNGRICFVQLLNLLFMIICFLPRGNFFVDLSNAETRNLAITIICITGNFFVAPYLVRYINECHITFLFYLTFAASAIRIFSTYSVNDLAEGIRGMVRLGDEIYTINDMGMFFSIMALFFAYRVLSDSRLKKLDIVFCTMCVLFGLATGSRKAFLIFLIGMAGLVYKYYKNSGIKMSKKLMFIVLGIVVCSVLMFLEGGDGIAAVFDRTVNVFTKKEKSESDILRKGMIQYGLENWAECPLMGHGMDMFRELSPYNVYAHNNFVEMLFDYGIIGLMLYYIPRLIVISAAARYASKCQDVGYAWFIFITSTALLLSDVAAVSYISDQQFLFWLACAFLGNYRKKRKQIYIM